MAGVQHTVSRGPEFQNLALGGVERLQNLALLRAVFWSRISEVWRGSFGFVELWEWGWLEDVGVMEWRRRVTLLVCCRWPE